MILTLVAKIESPVNVELNGIKRPNWFQNAENNMITLV